MNIVKFLDTSFDDGPTQESHSAVIAGKAVGTGNESIGGRNANTKAARAQAAPWKIPAADRSRVCERSNSHFVQKMYQSGGSHLFATKYRVTVLAMGISIARDPTISTKQG
jgi:hypothetical protein